jgi:3-oxoacyl-[acyl-carrier-protein] synthase II
VCPLGATVDGAFDRLIAGADARGPVTVIDVTGCRVTQAAQSELPDLPGVPDRRLRRMSRASRLAVPAARDALAQAGLLDAAGRCAVARLDMSLSTTASGMEMGEAFLRGAMEGRRGRGQITRVANYQAQQQVNDLHDALGFDGPVMLVANACASGANAIGHALDLIQSGTADIVLAGGYEALCDLVYTGFDCLQALSPDLCRPFDRTRRGLMLGEAAAFLVIESEAHAKQRGVPVLAALTGYGHTTDWHHLTQPAPTGEALARAMRMALERAGLTPDRIGYLNAHGTATPLNDGAEAGSYVTVFGDALAGLRLSSTKAAVGHTLGAAGSLEAIFSIGALRSGRLPPQLNLVDPEPSVADILVKPGETRELGAVLSVNLGFGGSNAALIFERADA